MTLSPLRTLVLAGAAVAGLAGCTDYYDDYGYGYGRSYYGSSYYAPSRSYYGWYNDYYYPGVGVYIFDRSGSRYRWTDDHRRYWGSWRGERRENWDGYRRDNRGWQGRQWDRSERPGRDYRRR